MRLQLGNLWERHRSRVKHAALLVLGIVAVQCCLYLPSLAGHKILLPSDILARRGVSLPQTAEVQRIPIRDQAPIDLVAFYEPARRSGVASRAAGELPFWSPDRFAGAPLAQLLLSPANADHAPHS